VENDVQTGIVFWVVVRDRATRAIVSATPCKTHHEAIQYNIDADHGTEANPREVAIEILSSDKEPK
jgi:hypothetical protein